MEDAMSTDVTTVDERFALSAQDIAELDALDGTGDTDRALERTRWRS